ncbi:MAG: lysoplasmalogenase [Bacteroidales bacterium]|nr:lysoplasmalogenase [Bacteroidales bacterium]
MRKNAVWYIPGAFFLIACILNFIGCIQGTGLADIVKPALLPLLSATTLAFLLGREVPDFRQVELLVTAQLLGCTGDILLIHSGFAFFVTGIVAFLVGHLFYMCLFGGLSWKGLTVWQWAISAFAMAAIVLAIVKAIGIEGPLFWPMLLYGFILMLLIFSALAGVLRMPRGSRATWWILLAGALLFAFSDACIAMDTFGVISFTFLRFVIMITYLAAQSLLAVGGIRVILGK